MLSLTHIHPIPLVGLAGLLLTACASAAPAEPSPSPEPSSPPATAMPTVQPTAPAEPTEDTSESDSASSCGDPFAGVQIQFPSQFWSDTDFCKHSVELSEIIGSGLPPDQIPAIDDPVFETVADADRWLGDDWPVMVFELDGEIRAYPLAILIWHEIVNDDFNGNKVVLTFCPLCNSTIAFDAMLADGTALTFGTTGNLRNSDLVMYDRQTQTWWQQFTGEAIIGELTGTQLEFLPSQIIAWSDFKQSHSDSKVLSRATGAIRRYGENPYPGYDSILSSPFFPVSSFDDRLPPMERVVALTVGETDIAFPFRDLSALGAINTEVEGQPVAVFWKAGTRSTFGDSDVDTGSTGAFLRQLDGQMLSFRPAEGGFEDEETGSRWNIFGEAVEGPLSGSRLARLVSGEHFWFAWAVFMPDTVVWTPES